MNSRDITADGELDVTANQSVQSDLDAAPDALVEVDGVMVGLGLSLVGAVAAVAVYHHPVQAMAAAAPVVFVGWLLRWGRDGKPVQPLDRANVPQ